VSALSLTFDDGPDPVWTPQLLDVLRDAGAQATFFPISGRASQHPDLIARMLTEGHAIGLHCDEHVRHSMRGLGWLRRDTRRALAALERVGARPRLWRTPWGDVAPWSTRVAAEHGLRLVGWTADTHDWRGDRATNMFASLRGGLDNGAVILAHDGIGPGARRTGIAETIEFVRLLIAHAKRSGIRLEALA
jgi:peptidoglycan/xylan/chitin deacetylase (PgdA/CDA1 family)